MAEIVGGLFGVTPEALQMQREKQSQQEALNFAQLQDPFARANYQIYQGASGLGRQISGLLGAQDPEMMRIQQRQQMLQGLDLSSPESLKQGIQTAMQNRDYQLVSELTNRYQQSAAAALKARETEANISAKLGEKTTNEMKNAGGYADTVAQRGTPEWTASYNEKLNELTTRPEKAMAYGPEAERVAKGQFGKPFNQLTQAEANQVDMLLEARGLTKAKAGKTDLVLPGVAKAGDVTGLRKDLQAITKPYQDQADAAGDAVDLANMAIKSNNFAAVSSLSRSLAKAAGETQLSRNDVEAFGIDPSLVGSVSDTVSRLAQSRPTVDTLTKLRQLAEALKKKAESRISIEEQQLQDTARVSGQFTDPQIETVFRRRPKEAGNTSFNSVAEAEAAKLPKGTIITINGRRARVE
jgi:hypothetical protein